MVRVTLFDDPALTPLHRRAYDVQAWKRSDTEIVLRGTVQDVKPPGLYVVDDPDTLTVHHMIVELTLAFPSLVITAAQVSFAEHPHDGCPQIIDHYQQLVGLSITRGFTQKARELFGGPRGCTHTTALLQAMAPVAVQCTWSMRLAKMREAGVDPQPPMDAERRRMMVASNINTCHVWAEGGAHAAMIAGGEGIRPPNSVTRRMVELGRKPEEWVSPLRR